MGDGRFIERALIYRKIFGGGMRQVGILAAAGLYAIEHNITRLKEDHEKARVFFSGIRDIKGITIDPDSVETNMVIANISGTGRTQAEVLESFKSRGLLLTPERQSSVRAVMHLDVSMEEVREGLEIFRAVFE
jgi:threonine aldolase